MPLSNERRDKMTVAIVGAGFTGSMTAVQLLHRAQGTVRVMLIDPRQEHGRGVAYSTGFDGHLLNVRARNMSAYPDDPGHFARWAQSHFRDTASPDEYLPRRVYGQYIAAQLLEAREAYPEDLRCIQDEAIGLVRRGDLAEIQLSSGRLIRTHQVVLALGNFPPRDMQLPGKSSDSTRFINDPWSKPDLSWVQEDESVLLIGSGLTSVDVVMELRGRGFKGTIHVLSRRGLLPQRHVLVEPISPPAWEEIPRTARGLLRAMRGLVKAKEAEGVNWRSVVDSIRPLNQEIWQSLPLREQRRFLRHVRPYWDVHRHRVAGPVGEQLADEIEKGRLRIHAGRIADYREDEEGVWVGFRRRECGRPQRIWVEQVMNCTGPDGDLRNVASPLVSDLLKKNLARPDELRLGLDVSSDGEVIDGHGRRSGWLFAAGPLLKGKLWESIAVPELRVQAEQLAARLAAEARRAAEVAEDAEPLQVSGGQVHS